MGFETAISKVNSVRLEMRIVLKVCGSDVKLLKNSGLACGLVYSRLLMISHELLAGMNA